MKTILKYVVAFLVLILWLLIVPLFKCLASLSSHNDKKFPYLQWRWLKVSMFTWQKNNEYSDIDED
jgi:hypothetical protein